MTHRAPCSRPFWPLKARRACSAGPGPGVYLCLPSEPSQDRSPVAKPPSWTRGSAWDGTGVLSCPGTGLLGFLTGWSPNLPGWGVGHKGPGILHGNGALGDSQLGKFEKHQLGDEGWGPGVCHQARWGSWSSGLPLLSRPLLYHLGLCCPGAMPQPGPPPLGDLNPRVPPNHPQNNAHTCPAPQPKDSGQAWATCTLTPPGESTASQGSWRVHAQSSWDSAQVHSRESMNAGEGTRGQALSSGGPSFRAQSNLAAGSRLGWEEAGHRPQQLHTPAEISGASVSSRPPVHIWGRESASQRAKGGDATSQMPGE